MVTAAAIQKLPTSLRPVTDEQGANAAVSLILKPEAEDFEILLVKRAIRQTDPWSGQMALPGGKREPQDANLKATAIRETLEETGIDLRESLFLGVLDAVHSEPRRDLRILPFVVQLRGEPEVKLNFGELDAYLWVPYETIIQSRGKTVQPDFGEVSAFLLQDEVVWGITYKILQNLHRTLQALTAQ